MTFLRKRNVMMLLIAVMMLSIDAIDICAQSTGIYVGGHIRRNRPTTITTLKNSGFTYVILFNVNVESDGTLTTDGETICSNGSYVFGNTQPNYVSDIAALKTAPTSISRIEICIGGWGNTSYTNIKNLINSNGTGSGTILYRNFKALKDAIPGIDAVNNDDESCYDTNTTVQFHTMMYNLGYKTTIAPYMNKSHWSSVVSQLGSKCDRVLLQCYDGGASNNPSDWNLSNTTLHAGRTNYQTDMSTSINQMQSWKNNNGVTGGFVWIYNDETWNLNAWATAMNRVFGAKTTDRGVATMYSDASYGGYAINLPEGTFTQADLALYGIAAKDISSLKVTPGYKVTLYKGTDLSGNSNTWTANTTYVGSDYNDQACSIKIEPNGVSGLSGIHKIKNRNSGQYIDLDGNSTANNTAIVQWTDEGTEAYQQWRFNEIATGVYTIQAASQTGRGMDVAYASTDNGTQVLLYDYNNGSHQQFIAYDKGSGYYQFVARFCGKVIEMPSSSTTSGDWIKTWENNGSNTQQWSLERPYPTDITDNGGQITASHSSVNSAEAISKLTDNDSFTKYCAFINAGDVVWMQYFSPVAEQLTSYALTSANDVQGRDPKTWTLQGSNDGTNWETIDSRSGETFGSRYQRNTYSVSTSNAYRYFRLRVTKTQDESITVFQLAEWQLFGTVASASDTPTDISDATSETSIRIYPNPAVNDVTVAGVSGQQITIYSMTGSKLMTTTAESGEQHINVSNLPKGSYIIHTASRSFVLIKN